MGTPAEKDPTAGTHARHEQAREPQAEPLRQPVPSPPIPPTTPEQVAAPAQTGPSAASLAEPGHPRTHRWGLGAYVLVQVVFLATSAVIGVLIFDPQQRTVAAATTALAVPTVLAAALALLITRQRGNGPAKDLRWVWSWRDVGMGLAFGFGGLVLTVLASMVYVAIVGPDVSSAVGEVFGGLRTGIPGALTVWVIVVVVAPLCEEIVYRGLLWGALEKYGLNRWAVLAITTVIFAGAHLELTRMPLLLVISIPIGLARMYTGRLLPSVVAHQVNNVLPGIALALGLLGVVPL